MNSTDGLFPTLLGFVSVGKYHRDTNEYPEAKNRFHVDLIRKNTKSRERERESKTCTHKDPKLIQRLNQHLHFMAHSYIAL